MRRYLYVILNEPRRLGAFFGPGADIKYSGVVVVPTREKTDTSRETNVNSANQTFSRRDTKQILNGGLAVGEEGQTFILVSNS